MRVTGPGPPEVSQTGREMTQRGSQTGQMSWPETSGLSGVEISWFLRVFKFLFETKIPLR